MKLLILRGVSDLIGKQSGEAYGNFELLKQRAEVVMNTLFKILPVWINYIEKLP